MTGVGRLLCPQKVLRRAQERWKPKKRRAGRRADTGWFLPCAHDPDRWGGDGRCRAC